MIRNNKFGGNQEIFVISEAVMERRKMDINRVGAKFGFGFVFANYESREQKRTRLVIDK